MATAHNHSLLAARTTIAQNQALEVQANVRPNPTLFTDWEYLPLPGVHPDNGLAGYLHDSTEGDLGMSYLFERGQKRQHRVQAAKDTTAVSRSSVTDNERTLAFGVAQLYITAQLADSTLDLARQVGSEELSEYGRHQANSSSSPARSLENDFLQIKLQITPIPARCGTGASSPKPSRFPTLRQQIGYESVPAEYDISDALEYRPLAVKVDDLQKKALDNRQDLHAAQLSITAAPEPIRAGEGER